MEKPNNIKEITFDFILEHIKTKGATDKSWLKKLVSKKIGQNKKGEDRTISFVEIRNEFVKKYMPEIIPPPKEKKPTMKEKLTQL
ncbi:MAG: hypothetical protein FWG34_11905 [Oscillospiraceae bacterium]|nr:hypothetical protein [Oscillospiraceae bacterium]